MSEQIRIHHKTEKRINKKFDRIVKSLENLEYAQRSSEELTKILKGIQDERGRLFRESGEIEIKHEREILGENPPDNKKRQAWIEMARVNHRHFERLGHLQSNVYDALQEQIIRERMILNLGGSKRFIHFEFLVFLLIILVLILLANEFFLDPSLNTLFVYFLIDVGCCSVFLREFYLRLSCADDRSWYWSQKSTWIDLLTSIPIPASIPFVRSGRLFRLLRIIRLARIGRFLFLGLRGFQQLGRVANVRLLRNSFVAILILLAAGTVLFAKLEHGHAMEAVETQGEQFWWTFTTVVTQGFADIYDPKGPLTRILTAILVISGIVFVGIFTATLTSMLVGDKAEEQIHKQRELIDLRLQLLERRIGVRDPDDALSDLDAV